MNINKPLHHFDVEEITSTFSTVATQLMKKVN